nr:RNA-directed DNA polymerase, eukaryota [Tanacetum cinerariifolium]
MGAYNKNSLQSKADQTVRISKSVFVSNFPEGCTVKYLWKVCNDYGTVVDVFIPNKKSKVGKRFAFVRFIKVINLDRLIENLNTIWIGRFHLFANPVRFERPKKPNLLPHNNVAVAYPRGVDQAKGQFQTRSYVNVVNGSSPVGVHGHSISSTSVLVLDDSCVVERDLSNHGEPLDIEDNFDSSFGCKRLCIKTKLPLSILESFMVIFKGKVYMVRAKELFTWSPIFLGQKEMEYTSDEDFDVRPQKYQIVRSFVRRVNDDRSEDPFNIYRLLRKQPGDESHEVSSSLSHPPGFTQDVSVIRNENGKSTKEIPGVVNAKVMNNSQYVYKEASCDNVDSNNVKKGGSILGIMEDMIRVGKAMGYSMDGFGHKTKKEWIKELTSKNKINFMAIQETKTHSVNHMDVKFMWGNSNYNYVYGEAVGNSGSILCVWEATVFKKDYATISDNFVAVYGTWSPSNSKVLFVAIYAPQQVVVLGDFNEVHNIDERRGSCFNTTSARFFDQFISASGLVDMKMEGYTFTWPHPSGSKMSKLDRFLVSEGIFLIFPSITAVCLDRHLSDHRSIILCEVQADFGLIPFRFYHSWISLEGFDAMVEQTCRLFSHNDANKMIRFKKNIRSEFELGLRIRDRVFLVKKDSIKKELSDNDRLLDGGDVSDSNLLRRSELHRNLYNINQMESKEYLQKSKIKWAI